MHDAQKCIGSCRNCAAMLLSVPISHHFHGCTALLVALVVVSGAILNTHLYLYPFFTDLAHDSLHYILQAVKR